MTSSSTSLPNPYEAEGQDFPVVAVLGFGAMGAGIAHVLAHSGRRVRVLESDSNQARAGEERLRASVAAGLRRGVLDADTATDVEARVTTALDVGELADVDLVVESVIEAADVKRPLLAAVASVVGDEVPILTNTSALSVTELAAGVRHPERFAGLHFFNPAPVMPTVEIVAGLQTSPDLVDRLVKLVETLPDKTAVVVQDRPGFLLNALLLPYLNDVIQELDDELASPEDIDLALELGLGYRTGPLAMLDLIGLDVHLKATEAIFAATGDPRYAAPPLLRRMVASGRLGRKSGAGFRIGGPLPTAPSATGQPSSVPTGMEPSDPRTTT